ncbi:MAG: hypothetical protein OCD76_22230 [Reichenbachiella sp.]
MIRVVLTDDLGIVRRGIKLLLEREVWIEIDCLRELNLKVKSLANSIGL